MSEDIHRVQFKAPDSLIERADAVAELLDTSRTSLLIEALREQLDDITADEDLRRRAREAYYRGDIELETLAAAVGYDEAQRVQLLARSLSTEFPVPAIETDDLPSDEAFYGGEPPTVVDESSGSESGESADSSPTNQSK